MTLSSRASHRLSNLPQNWFSKLSIEEIEQEIYINQWKDSSSFLEAFKKALITLAFRELKFSERTVSINRYNPALVDLEPFDELEFVIEPRFLQYLSFYERYIVSLLYQYKKKEVCSILNCTSSYLSKCIRKIKLKILSSS